MTETPAEPAVTIASQSIELLLTGQPDVPYRWGAGSIRPGIITFTYRQDGIHAHLYGAWVREDGHLTDQPCDQAYRIGDTDEWPDWMAALAREHKPSDRAPAVDQAALRDRIAEALADALKPRYGGPQHNTPGGLPLTATPEEVRLHRAQPLADAVLAVLPETARLHDEILTLQAELAKMRDLLRAENERANAAIDRETTGEAAEEEQRLALSQALGLGTGGPWEAIHDRAAELETENARMRHELEVMYGGAFDSLKPPPADRADDAGAAGHVEAKPADPWSITYHRLGPAQNNPAVCICGLGPDAVIHNEPPHAFNGRPKVGMPPIDGLCTDCHHHVTASCHATPEQPAAGAQQPKEARP